MDYSMYLFYGLAGDLRSSHGSGELDDLDDRLLHDIGYSRFGGRVVKDVEPYDEPDVGRRALHWPRLDWHLLIRKFSDRHVALTR